MNEQPRTHCCGACGSELAPTLLSCPRCGRLVHAEELKRLARDAEAAAQAGQVVEALATWRRAHMNYVRAAEELPEDRFGEGEMATQLLHRTAVDDFRQHAADIRAWRQTESI